MSRYLLVRSLLTVMAFAVVLAAAGPALASAPAPRQATAWTIYGDVIVEITSPKDQHSGVVLRPR
jgi:hypothetical protein